MLDARRAQALRPLIHHTLRTGVIASGVLLAAGLILTTVRASNLPTEVPPFSSVLRGALHFDGPSLLALGLLVLMATPVARVAALAAGWLWAGDRRYGGVAAVVLAILLGSMALGVG